MGQEPQGRRGVGISAAHTLEPVVVPVRWGDRAGELLRRRTHHDGSATLVIAVGERIVLHAVAADTAARLDGLLGNAAVHARGEPLDLDSLPQPPARHPDPPAEAPLLSSETQAPVDAARAEAAALEPPAPAPAPLPETPRPPAPIATKRGPPRTRTRPGARSDAPAATAIGEETAVLRAVARLRNQAGLAQPPERIASADPDDLFATHPAEDILASGFVPRPYQSDAVAAWLANDGRGILNMATGTGKTLTSLLAAAALWPEARLVVVACPTRILVEQWRREIRAVFPGSSIADVGHDPNWRDAAPLPDGPTFLVGTLQGLSRSAFRHWFEREQDAAETLLIADEVHRVGSPAYGKLLDLPFRWRLGLSATPRRDWDAAGNERLRLSFETEVYHYGLGAAIENAILVPYTYHIHPLPMTREERRRYGEVSSRLAQTLGGMGFDPERASLARFLEERRSAGDREAENVRSLLVRRAKLLKEARVKEKRIRDVLTAHDLPRCLVYCNTKRQVDDFARVLAAMDRPAVRYTSGMDRAEREQALAAFHSEAVGTLVAIKCLDEGVDIPEARTAVLVSSSTTEREFIQRRGRVLRRAPGKTEAAIHDLLVLPVDPASFHGRLEGAEHAAVVKEVRRAAVFNRHAMNRAETATVLETLLARLGFTREETKHALAGHRRDDEESADDEPEWELAATVDAAADTQQEEKDA